MAEETCLLDDGVKLGADGGADQREAKAELTADCAAGATAYCAADRGADALAEQQRKSTADQGVGGDVLAAASCLFALPDLVLKEAWGQRWERGVKKSGAAGESGAAADWGDVEATDAAALCLCCSLGGLGCTLACLSKTFFGANGGGRSGKKRSTANRGTGTALTGKECNIGGRACKTAAAENRLTWSANTAESFYKRRAARNVNGASYG